MWGQNGCDFSWAHWMVNYSLVKIESVFKESWDLTNWSLCQHINKFEEDTGILWHVSNQIILFLSLHKQLLSKHLKHFKTLFWSCLLIMREFPYQKFLFWSQNPNLKPKNQGNPSLTLSLTPKIASKLHICYIVEHISCL